MLPEMHLIEDEILPMLRERAPIQREKASRQLRQWRGEKGLCCLMTMLHEDDVPVLKRLPYYDLQEIHSDPEKMFVSQFRGAAYAAFSDGDAVPSVRANVGCGCLNTLLGGLKQTYFPDKMPWLLEHLTADRLLSLSEADITDSPEFTRGLEEMRLMKELLRGTGIEVFPMDIQGPIDMAHLWLGDEFFYLVYDDPDVIHHALRLAVSVIDYAFRKNLEIIAPGEYVCHYNCLALPADAPLKLSEDTSTLLSAEHLANYMLPYTGELFERFGGGYIHYCGSNPHLLPLTERFPGSRGLNFGNPERHNIPGVLAELGRDGKFLVETGPTPVPLDEQVRAAARDDGTFNVFPAVCCRKADEERVIGEFRECVQKCSR